jgi:hypothetical protein
MWQLQMKPIACRRPDETSLIVKVYDVELSHFTKQLIKARKREIILKSLGGRNVAVNVSVFSAAVRT